MVVRYPVPTQSSNLTFFTHTARILFHKRGSIILMLGPQLFIAVGLSFLALWRNPLTILLPPDAQPQAAYVVVGFLVCFLTFFKTQTAYAEHLSAHSAVEDVLQESRRLGTMVCTILDWDVDPDIKPIARRILRLIVVQYFVTAEFLTRTGPNKTQDKAVMDRLRNDVKLVTGPKEYSLLYPDEPRELPGSKSRYRHANPINVMLWIQLMLMEAQKKGAIVTAPALNICVSSNMQLYQAFWGLNRVDKTQFPFPYAQLVKLLTIVYVFSYPFVLEPSCRQLTPFAMLVIAIGFFGCEAVAEILESPFGTDDNDIDLKYYGQALIRDLEVLYYNRETKPEFVFDDEHDLSFGYLLDGLGYNNPRRTPSQNYSRRSGTPSASTSRLPWSSSNSDNSRTAPDSPQITRYNTGDTNLGAAPPKVAALLS